MDNQQPQQAQPVAPQPVVPGQPVTPQGYPMENPGQTLGIIGLVCNFLGVSVAGIILGVMSRNKSKQYNMSTTIGTISMVWGIIATVFYTLLFLFWLILFIIAVANGDSSSTSSYSSSSY